MLAVDYGASLDPEEVGFCTVDGGRIWYRLNGKRHFRDGAIPLICVHGGPGLSHHYMLSLATLSKDRPVLFYDQLDSGNSDRPNRQENWHLERFVKEIDYLRQHLNLTSIAILGSSWGGTIAAEYALSEPKGVCSLILASPVIDVARWISDCSLHRSYLTPATQQILSENEQAETINSDSYQRAVLEFYERHLCRLKPWPWEINRSFELFNYPMYQAMWGPAEFTCSGSLKDYSCVSRLSDIRVPTLYTCGEHDEATPAACREFARVTGNARVEVFEGCSHTPHLEAPDNYLRVISAFLSSL